MGAPGDEGTLREAASASPVGAFFGGDGPTRAVAGGLSLAGGPAPVVCGTIASCDDYDDIVDWGEAHLAFLRRFLPYFHGLPCADWLRTLMNRLDPALFSACFMAWAREAWPDAPDLVAIDGKTSRRSHDRGAGKQALHLVSAFATNERLVLGQEAVADTSCEQMRSRPCWTARRRWRARGRARDHRRHRLQSHHRGRHHGQRGRLPAGREAEPAQSARRDRSLFRRHAGRSLEVHVDIDKDHGRIETRRWSSRTTSPG